MNDDKLIELVSKYGYGWVALPSNDIKIFQIYVANENNLSLIGTIRDVIDNKKGLPRAFDDESVTSISGKLSNENKNKFRFKWLRALQGLFQLNTQAKADIDASESISFAFSNIKKNEYNIVNLNDFLYESKIKDSFVNGYLDEIKRGNIYIVYSILKTNSINIDIAHDTNSQFSALTEETKLLNAALDFTMRRDKNNGIKMSHEGSEDVVFAFKAAKVFMKNNKVFVKIDKDNTELAIRGDDAYPVEVFQPQDLIVFFD